MFEKCHPLSPPKYHPEINRARAQFSHAIELGLIVRPQKCSWCGIIKEEIHGHHPDYSKIFSVIWLCRSCHLKIHGVNKNKVILFVSKYPQIEKFLKLKNKNYYLVKTYLNQGLKQIDIALCMGMSKQRINYWVKILRKEN